MNFTNLGGAGNRLACNLEDDVSLLQTALGRDAAGIDARHDNAFLAGTGH